jgi:hypothetical protein
MKHKCKEKPQHHEWLWYDNGEWIFDTDDGLRGPEIFFCPWCGKQLPKERVTERQELSPQEH